MTCNIEGYLHEHGYAIVDKDAMPFLRGLTKIDLIVFDHGANAIAGVSLRRSSASAEDDMAEWTHKDMAYFKRATKRWCEKQKLFVKYRADAIFVRPNGELDHVIGREYTRVKEERREVK